MKEKIMVRADGREMWILLEKSDASALKKASTIVLTGMSADVEEKKLFSTHWSGNARIQNGVNLVEKSVQKSSNEKVFVTQVKQNNVEGESK